MILSQSPLPAQAENAEASKKDGGRAGRRGRRGGVRGDPYASAFALPTTARRTKSVASMRTIATGSEIHTFLTKAATT